MPTASTSQLPSTAEILASNESKQLYRTNLLRLQLDELYSNLTPAYEKLAKVDKLVSDVTAAVQAVKEVTIPADCRHVFPLLSIQSIMLTDMSFKAPVSISVVGSYKHRSIVKPFQNVDISLVMPGTCFAAKDFKAGRYHDRRTVYCGELVRQLSESLPSLTVSVDFRQNDTSRAFVQITVPNSAWKLNLLPTLPVGTFSESKLTPEYCNLRDSTECDPLYNASILADMVTFVYPSHVHFAKAVQLIKVWMYRRNALSTGFSGYHIDLLLSHICQSVPREVSAYQLFKLFLVLVSSTRWGFESLVFGKSGAIASPTPSPKIELPGTIYNPLWNVPMFLIEELSVFAADSLRVLDDSTEIDVYEFLFSPRSASTDFELTLSGKKINRIIAENVYETFKIGLKNRISNFSIRFDPTSITLTGTTMGNTDLVEKGPSADSAEAKEFKKFWGQKSELRRFRDGSILECVVWQPSSGVIEQIVLFISCLKFPHLHPTVSVAPLGIETKPAVSLWAELEQLRTNLSEIALPLSIVDVRPSDPRFTATQLGVAPLCCVVEFESSPAWPTNRAAIRHSKCAFLLAIREGLLTKCTQVEISTLVEEPFVDVRMESGSLFRIYLFVASERLLVERAMESSVPPSLAEIASVSDLWFLLTLRARMHATSIETPGICGAVQMAKIWLDNHLLLEPYLGPWVECTVATVATPDASAHSLVLSWLFMLAHHSWRTTPLFVRWNSDLLETDKYDQAVDSRKAWWVSSDIDPHCVYLRRPSEWEANRIQKLAKKAIDQAARKEWTKIKCHTDNSAVYDLLLTVKAGIKVNELAKHLNEQFRKYFTFHASETHRVIGVVFEDETFCVSANKSALLTVVDNVTVPDFTVLMDKLRAIVHGSVDSIKVRK